MRDSIGLRGGSLSHFEFYRTAIICNKSDTYLDFNGVCTLSIEISEWEILLQMLEKEVYLPSLSVYGNDLFRRHIHIYCCPVKLLD